MIPEDVMKLARETLQLVLAEIPNTGSSIHERHEAKVGHIARAILTDREARSGWRDIASLTPEDGMIVVGYGEYRERDGFSPAFMRWHAVLNGWTVTGMPFYPTHWMPIPAAPSASPSPSREETEGEKEKAAVTYSQEEYDEAYEIGKRDGYSDAVQDIDEKTGGDGEYRYCLGMEDDIRHQPDPATMIQRIVDRFETLNLLEDASKSGRDQEWGDKPSASALLLEAEKAQTDHARGCQGREYTCTCGYDDTRDKEIARLRALALDYQAAYLEVAKALEPFAKAFEKARETYSKRYSDNALGAANFDKMPDRWAMDNLTFNMGNFRAVRAALSKIRGDA